MSKEKEFIQRYEEDFKNQNETNTKMLEMLESLHNEVKSLREQGMQDDQVQTSGAQDDEASVKGLQDESADNDADDSMKEADGESEAPEDDSKKPTLDDIKALAAELGFEVTLTKISEENEEEESEEDEAEVEVEEPVEPMNEGTNSGQQDGDDSGMKESFNEQSIFTELANSFGRKPMQKSNQ